MRKVLSAAAALLLAGCIDGELVVHVEDDGSVEMKSTTSIDRGLYEANAEQQFCPKGEITLDEMAATCTLIVRTTLKEMMDRDGASFLLDDPTDIVQVTALGEGRIRIAFDLAGMLEDSPPEVPPPEVLAMLREAFEGHGLRFQVEGERIVSTTGTLSRDGGVAGWTIPFSTLFEANPDLGRPFVTVIEAPGA